MLQRVESGAHFPSDVFAGAALGVLITGIGCDKRLLGQLIK
jgi:membrane-associated phospholipid phosphatase